MLEGARSVLCVALRYRPLAGAVAPSGDLWPKVASYARGRDYHNMMVKRLRKLAKRIRQAFPGTDTRNYVDTGPVLERELAARAGLGVAGKNTCLLDRQGSWFLLGELFLTLDLQPDSPLTDLCGRCTRCLDACPTGALPEPYRLDANRCISYWTIEHRGTIPGELRDRLDGWVFGCDLCQEVCPWNLRDSPAAEHPGLRLSRERAELDLIALLALSPAEYEQRFRGSAMQRAGLAGLQRNAALAMAHRGEPRYLAPLAAALRENPEPVVRGHAAWALGRIGGGEARRALASAQATEANAEVRAEIAAALAAAAPVTTAGPAAGEQVG